MEALNAGNLARHPSGGMLGLEVNCQTSRAFSCWGAGVGGDRIAVHSILLVGC